MVSQNAVIAAFSSTALISLAPNVLLFLFPHFASGEGQNSPILSLGQCLAAGRSDIGFQLVDYSLSFGLLLNHNLLYILKTVFN